MMCMRAQSQEYEEGSKGECSWAFLEASYLGLELLFLMILGFLFGCLGFHLFQLRLRLCKF